MSDIESTSDWYSARARSASSSRCRISVMSTRRPTVWPLGVARSDQSNQRPPIHCRLRLLLRLRKRSTHSCGEPSSGRPAAAFSRAVSCARAS